MTPSPNHLLLTFYGDDFTGSTDALEFLYRAGAKAVLFMRPPTPEQLERYSGLQAVGIAGMSRAMSPEMMEQELRPAFKALGALGAPHLHYKVCSTFDSSPTIGSIGKAIDIGKELFPHNTFVPVLGGTPALGRHCVFGNLFARMGIGSSGSIHRLDRHPSMSRHPVTPSDESDLRLLLSRQTKKQIGLLDILQIARPLAETKKALRSCLDEGAEVLLLDALYEEQMTAIGELIDSFTIPGQCLFSVGSSGIEMALGAWFQEQGRLTKPQSWTSPGKASPLLVISGSRSPVTAGQIAWAVSNGFTETGVDTTPDTIISLLRQGNNVIVHTGTASVDRIPPGMTAQVLGTALGRIARDVMAQIPLQRLVIAGGDTSSFAARALDIEAVEMIAPLSPGAPLCKASAPTSPADGIEINLKGGQVGADNYFGKILEGK